MDFRNISELNSYLMSRTGNAVALTEEAVYQVIDRFVKEYYAEYSPVEYDRTYQLYRSLVRTSVRATPNGNEAYVYFDLDKLDYYMHHIRINGKRYAYPQTMGNDDLAEMVVKAADKGIHGSKRGMTGGTSIWTKPIRSLSKDGRKLLKRMLIESGIPVR